MYAALNSQRRLKKMNSRVFIVALMLLTPVHLFAQRTVNVTVTKDSRIVATQELDAVIAEATDLNDKPAIINIKSRAAMLVSFSDPVRSETMFLELWKSVNDDPDTDFDKQRARLVILKYLFLRNPKLARQLLAERAKLKDSSSQSISSGRDDGQGMAAKLASQLMDADPSAAASLLETSMSISATTASVGALYRLREKDSFLSDYNAGKALEELKTQPTLLSLPGINLLAAYVFPGPDASISSIEAANSLESLQFKYFLAAYEVLKGSLNETNEALLRDFHYTQRELQLRAAFQGQVAAILAALAPRVQPSLAVELTKIAAKLAPQVPSNVSQIMQPALARLSGNGFASEDAEQRFFFFLSSGDFDEAGKQLDRLNDDKKKDVYTQLLNRNHAKALLAQSDVMGALTLIRKLDDQTSRLVMYVEALKTAKKKHESDLTTIIINEARVLIPQVDRNGLHVRALLSFVSQLTDLGKNDDAMELLNNALMTINALSKKTDDQAATRTAAEAAMAELNDPNSLLDAAEMDQAFSLVGLRDLERGLALARKIEPRAVQLVARLETIQGIVKRPPSNPKVTAKPGNG
jgi:hypothetical protein